MTKRQAKRRACQMAASALHLAIVGGSWDWEPLWSDEDAARIRSAINELSEELHRRGPGRDDPQPAAAAGETGA